METIEALRAREEEEKRSPAFVLGVICIGYFMVIMDATVTNVALPSIGRGLHGSVTGLQWVVDAYTLSFAGAWRHTPGANINPGGDFLTGPTLGRGMPTPSRVRCST